MFLNAWKCTHMINCMYALLFLLLWHCVSVYALNQIPLWADPEGVPECGFVVRRVPAGQARAPHHWPELVSIIKLSQWV